jgi:hypothetical protein
VRFNVQTGQSLGTFVSVGAPGLGGLAFMAKPTSNLPGTHISVTARTGYPGQLLGFFACLLRNSDHALIAGKTLTFRLDDTLLGTALTNTIKSAQLNFRLPSNISLGTHKITVSFAGDSTYQASTQTGTLTVGLPPTPQASYLWVRSLSGKVGQTVPLAAALQQNAGNLRIVGRTLSFSLDGKAISTVTTDSQGAAYVPYPIPAGTTAGSHTVSVSFAGDAAFAACVGMGTLTVLP